eukprot:2734832-Prymnesium_polylepis.2
MRSGALTRREIRRIRAVPTSPAGAELQHAEWLAVGGIQRRVRHGEMREKCAARIVCPAPQLVPPPWSIILCCQHEQHHPKDGILVAVGSRARADLGQDVIVKLPAGQALVNAVRAHRPDLA